MELIRQPNRWSCNACAWAMVLGLTLEQVIEAVGHDGSKIWHATLPEPRNRMGFFDEELTWLAVQQGYACTEIVLAQYATSRFHRACIPPVLCSLSQFQTFVRDRVGVLTVSSPRIPDGLHAVAYDGHRVFDPILGLDQLEAYDIHSFIWIERVRGEVV